MSLHDATALLTAYQYPATASEIAEHHGDFVLDLPNGTERLQTVLERTGEQTFLDAEDAVATLYGSVSKKAIGRQGYSDRDPTPMGIAGPDPVSF